MNRESWGKASKWSLDQEIHTNEEYLEGIQDVETAIKRICFGDERA